DVAERPVERVGVGGAAFRRLLPERVAELLGPVRMAAGDPEHGVERVLAGLLSGRGEALPDELPEEVGRDHAQLDLLRAPPERLVLGLEPARPPPPLAP